MSRHGPAGIKRALAEFQAATPSTQLRSVHVAAAMNVPQATVESWRSLGKGPPFVKNQLGHCIYRKGEVLAWAKTYIPAPQRAPQKVKKMPPTPKNIVGQDTAQLSLQFNGLTVDDYVTTPVMAAWLGVPAWVAEHWRYKNQGPAFVRANDGKRVLYKVSDVKAFRALKKGPLAYTDGRLNTLPPEANKPAFNNLSNRKPTSEDDDTLTMTRWSNAELEKLAVAAVKLRKSSKNMQPIDAIIAVQQFVLDADRQRTPVQIRKTPAKQKLLDRITEIETGERAAAETAKKKQADDAQAQREAERLTTLDAERTARHQAEIDSKAKLGVDIDAAHGGEPPHKGDDGRQWPFPLPKPVQSELPLESPKSDQRTIFTNDTPLATAPNWAEAQQRLEQQFMHRLAPDPAPRPQVELHHAVINTPKPVEWDANMLVQQAAMMLERVFVETAKRLLTNPDVAPLIRSFILRQVPDTHAEHAPPKHKPPAPAAPTAEKPLPRVLVCGMQNYHHGTLQSAMDGKLQLRFWHDDGTKGSRITELEQKAKGVDWAVCPIGETSHTVIGVLQKASVRIERTTGLGVSSVMSALNKIAGIEAPSQGAVAEALKQALQPAAPHAPSGVQQAPRAAVQPAPSE